MITWTCPRHFEARFPGRGESVSAARAFAREVLAALDVPEPRVGDALTCLSELATNAVRYSRSGQGGEFLVRLQVAGAHLLVEVADQGGPTGPVVSPPSLSGEGGRGLPIVCSLGSLRVSGDCDGRCVAARLPLSCQIGEGGER